MHFVLEPFYPLFFKECPSFTPGDGDGYDQRFIVFEHGLRTDIALPSPFQFGFAVVAPVCGLVQYRRHLSTGLFPSIN